MTSTSRPRVGAFVAIPLRDGSTGYGRILSRPYLAFYDYRTTAPSAELDIIGSKPLLFVQAVRLDDDERWAELGWRELEGRAAEPAVQFTQDVFEPRTCKIFDSAGMVRDAEPEECIGLERAAVWDVHHIEQRLLDTLLGRTNEAEMRARVRLPWPT